MNKPFRAQLTRRSAISAAIVMAAVVSGGGYALASGNSTPSASGDHDSLRYLVGSNVSVLGGSGGSNATKCPKGMYPIGGGPSSSRAVWSIQWSDADRSSPAAKHPNEWTVGLFNNSTSAASFKVFVVCSSATSVSGNY